MESIKIWCDWCIKYNYFTDIKKKDCLLLLQKNVKECSIEECKFYKKKILSIITQAKLKEYLEKKWKEV